MYVFVRTYKLMNVFESLMFMAYFVSIFISVTEKITEKRLSDLDILAKCLPYTVKQSGKDPIF